MTLSWLSVLLLCSFCPFSLLTAEVGDAAGECHPQNIDLFFVLDGSNGIAEWNFGIMKQFVAGVVQKLEVGGAFGSRVGVVEFNETGFLYFSLAQFNNKQDIVEAISDMPYLGGSSTNIAGALNEAITRGFTGMAGDRSTAPDVLILLTGSKDNSNVTASHELALKKNITKSLAIGVGDYFDPAELYIVTGGLKEHLFEVATVQLLDDITQLVCEQIQAVNPCGSNPCLNGGVCNNDKTSPIGFTCTCSIGWAGELCDHPGCDVDVLHTGAYVLQVQYEGKGEVQQTYLPVGVSRQFKALTGSSVTLHAVLGSTYTCTLTPSVCHQTAVIRCGGTTFVGFYCTCA